MKREPLELPPSLRTHHSVARSLLFKPRRRRSSQASTMSNSAPVPGCSIAFLATGSVTARCSLRGQPADRFTVTRLLRTFTDSAWCEPMPIGVFLISHPDGPILFDTGESPRFNEPGYNPIWNPGRFLTKTSIGAEDCILRQLEARGVKAKDLQAIVLSHLHSDHAGGLEVLMAEAPDVPIYLSSEHWAAYGEHPAVAALHGCLPSYWPKNFKPRIMVFADDSIGPWPTSSKITADGKITAVATPGHCPGHISLIVRGDDPEGATTTYFLTGDATYGIDLLDKEHCDGVTDDPADSLRSLKLIKDFARQRDIVVLPSHDANTPQLLRDRVVYRPT